jgi:hypothetical protein
VAAPERERQADELRDRDDERRPGSRAAREAEPGDGAPQPVAWPAPLEQRVDAEREREPDPERAIQRPVLPARALDIGVREILEIHLRSFN